MTFLGTCVHLLARALESAGVTLYRLGNLLHGCVPVFLAPTQLDALLNRHYAGPYYSSKWAKHEGPGEPVAVELEGWEADVCARYGIDSGRVLVLGCGWGREAIALAEKKAEVVGLDRHPGVLGTARRLAQERKVRARFVQADFLAIPHPAQSFDAALLSGTMYSAIAGLRRRQSWLQELSRALTPHGLIILSFQIQQGPRSSTGRLFTRLNQYLCRLPGANAEYQPGDVCLSGHFFHFFQDEKEIREELEAAGALVRELNWSQQYAIISCTFPC